MTNSDPESSPTLSHSPKPRMRIFVLLVGNPPMNIYINWAAPTIDIYWLFVDYPPISIYINWAAPTVDILFSLDYPPINIYQLGRSDG